MPNIFILSMPRAGSSMLSNLICSSGYKSFISPSSSLIKPSSLNPQGYFEDITFTLLNDQLLKGIYGNKYSFLYPPDAQSRKWSIYDFMNVISEDYFYDVDEKNVNITPDFYNNLREFTGQDWDVWGISRMINGGKWENCYKKNFVSDKSEIVETKAKIEKIIAQSNGLLIKDPRLTLTLELFDFLEDKNNLFIYLTRSEDRVVQSMRKHYGPNLFTDNLIIGNEFVSNHFNHRVGSMEWSVFSSSYAFISEKLPSERTLLVNYDEIVSKDKFCIDSIESFIGNKLNLDSIIQ